MTADYEPELGKRVKPKYYDILEDDESEEPGEIIMDMIRERARGYMLSSSKICTVYINN